jgi:hypothetical protein
MSVGEGQASWAPGRPRAAAVRGAPWVLLFAVYLGLRIANFHAIEQPFQTWDSQI